MRTLVCKSFKLLYIYIHYLLEDVISVINHSNVSWLTNPMTYAYIYIVIRCYLRIINHSYWSYVHQYVFICAYPLVN